MRCQLAVKIAGRHFGRGCDCFWIYFRTEDSQNLTSELRFWFRLRKDTPVDAIRKSTTSADHRNPRYDVSSWSRNFRVTLWFTFWLILRQFSDPTISILCKQN